MSALELRLRQLEQRLANLERQAGGGEQLSANYLSVDPTTGEVSATFSGTVNAAGVQLPANPASPGVDYGPSDYKITWQAIADGSQVALIEGARVAVADSNQLVLAATDGDGESWGSLNLSATNSPGYGEVAGSVSNNTTGANFIILDTNGESSFVQLPLEGKTIMSWGSVQTTTGTILNAGSGDWSVIGSAVGTVQLELGTTYCFLLCAIDGTYTAGQTPNGYGGGGTSGNPTITVVSNAGVLGQHNVNFIAIHD